MGMKDSAAVTTESHPKLAWASCRVVDGKDALKRRRRRPRSECNKVASAPPASLLLQGPVLFGSGALPSSPWVMCRLAATSISTDIATMLCYDDSIRVHGADWSDMSTYVKSCYSTTTTTAAAAAPSLDTSAACKDDSTHHHVCLGNIMNKTSFSPTSESHILATLQGSPPPLLSLAVRATVDACKLTISQQPLLQSCIKRQLIGIPIAWKQGTDNNKTITTTVRLQFLQEEWNFTVDSIAIQTCHANSLFFSVFPSTRITLLMEPAKEKEEVERSAAPSVTDGLPDLQFLSPTARLLAETLHCLRQAPTANLPRTLLLTGPPGVGKTYAVQTAVQTALESGPCTLTVLQGSQVLAQTGHAADASRAVQRHFATAAAQTALSTQHAQQQQQQPTGLAVIFLDECDALLSSEILTGTLGMLLDRVSTDPEWRRLVVVAATNRMDSIPSCLRRPGRFDREIPLSPPNTQERFVILQSVLQTSNLVVESDLELQQVADVCVGYVAADLAALVRRAALLKLSAVTSKDNDDDDETAATIASLLLRSMDDVGASALRDAALAAPPTTTWNDIAGDPGGAKTALRHAIEWPRTKRAAFQALGLTAPRGILLHGPPGCAKTTLARAAAGASGVAFLSLAPADVYASSYVGQAEAVVRRAFSLARSAAPCVLFFDEIDAVVGSDGSGGGHGMARGNSAEARVLSTFLNEMDGVDGSWKDGVLVLGATNRPWTLDAALLRPGRFDKVIYVPPPDATGRRSILEMQSRDWTMDEPLDLDLFASDAVTGNMTGAEIVGACRQAAMQCVRETLDNGCDKDNIHLAKMRPEYLEQALREQTVLLSNSQVLNDFQAFEDNCSR